MKDVSPGEEIALEAEAVNAWNRAANESRKRKPAELPSKPRSPARDGTILVRNDSAVDIERFGVLAIGDVIISPADNLEPFIRQPVASGIVPTDESPGKWVILQQPLPIGEIGTAVIAGTTQCKVKILSEDHLFVECETGRYDMPVSSESGPAQILYKQPAGSREVADEAWCVIRFGAGGASKPLIVVVCCGPNGPEVDPAPTDETYWVADAEVTNDDDDPTSAMTVAPKEVAKATTLTMRGSDTAGTLTATTEDHGLESGDTLDITWSTGSRTGVVVGTISGAEIPISGGSGDNLPAEDSAITYLCTVEGKEYCNWNIRLATCDNEVVSGTHLVPVGEPALLDSRPDKSDPVLTRYFFSAIPWFFFAFLAGYCSACGTQVTGGFAEWYPERWTTYISSEIGTGADTEAVTVHDSCIWNGRRYAVGTFNNLGGVAANNYTVAYWDDDLDKWIGISGSIERIGDTYARCLVHDFGSGEVLVVSGGGVGSYTDKPVQAWNGSTWTALPAIQTGHTWTAYCSFIWNDELYIGGEADTTCSIKGIAKYNGSSWEAVGAGTGLGDAGGGGTDPSPKVYALEAHDDGSAAGEQLYAAGAFVLAGGTAVVNVARWSGSAWSVCGEGIAVSATCYVRALKSWDDGESNVLYAAGIGLTAGTCVVGWDGNCWARKSDDLIAKTGVGDAEIETLEAAYGFLILAGHFQYRAGSVGLGNVGGAVGYKTGTPDIWEPLA